jgi:hypothetical protein
MTGKLERPKNSSKWNDRNVRCANLLVEHIPLHKSAMNGTVNSGNFVRVLTQNNFFL